MNRQQIKAVVAILKQRFNSLPAEEVVDIATRVIEAVEVNVHVKPEDPPA